MTTMFLEIGIFNIALIIMMICQTYVERKKYKDCLLFNRLLIAITAILTVDTIGWVIDGNPIGGHIWITTIIDGLDLLFTTIVCWCWVKYSLYIANDGKRIDVKWYKDFSNILLIIQTVLVISSQRFGFYYSIDSTGAYHRGRGYFIHTLISLTLLMYSSGSCIISYIHNKKKENLFVAFIILIPCVGNVFQLYIYGYPTVWICMVFMVFAVYIHIQNKRVNEERQEQNKALKEALQQAQQANIAKTEFFSRMSHDMRTPMNGILGLAALSLDEESNDIIISNIRKIKTAGEYMLGLINDTLDFQKIESGKMVLEPQVIAADELIESICSMVRETAKEKKINFRVEHHNMDRHIYLKADPLRVKQIFINLLSNAIKFTPEGGTVHLEINELRIDNKTYRSIVTITDTGIGMSNEFLQNGIFKPFSQEYNNITAKTSGTGLGLSICKQLVELMDGTITVESEQGSGTKFKVVIPFERVEEKVAVKNTEVNTEQMFYVQQALEGKHILLVEDHPLNAEIAKKLLSKMKCEVEWAVNGKEGIDKFADSEENQFDIILMDIRMPVMDGLEATRRIRSMERADAVKIPIIAMTANAYDEDMKQTTEAGMNEHIAKPIDPQLMYETIAKYVKIK